MTEKTSEGLSNGEDFGKYQKIVEAWADKHEMAYLLPEIKELLDEVSK